MAKILFFQELEFEYLGVMYISAALKKAGHDVSLIFINRTKDLFEEVKNIKPDFIAVSLMTGLHKNMLSLLKECKKKFPEIYNITGGPHPTFFPEMINYEFVDSVCLGEGEKAVIELIDSVIEKKYKPVNNVNYKISGKIINCEKYNEYISDLDVLPFADREIYYSHKFMLDIPTRAVIAARGCPYRCTFCFNEKYTKLFGNKNYVRFRSEKNLISELKQIIVKYPVSNFHFMDDTFTVNKKWLFNFLELYRNEINLPFVCLGTANVIDEEIVKSLKQSKCHSIFFGIECGNENYRNNVLKKPVKNESIINSCRILKKYKLPFKAFNIVGFPGETLEMAWETVKLNVKVKTVFPWCAIFMPYPGTELSEYAVKLGELNRNYSPDNIPESFHHNSILKNKEIMKIENLHKFFQTAVLFPFLIPIIKIIIKLPPNRIFNYWFGLIYFLVYYRAERRSFFKTLKFGLNNLKFLIKK